MPSESKPLLTAQTEKPNHYTYLKEFRVEQCPLFVQHKCTQHRPFTCFHWHFNNQRRRRPIRRRDGTFNYSADNYCTKYDETTGICPDGDECPFLHRTAGDTERRYHLRYYKTCMCVHDTDSRGYCAKNGIHCAFAHGTHDHRPPVYDIKEIQALEGGEGELGGGGGCIIGAVSGAAVSNGLNALDKERNLTGEDPKWQDTNHVLAYYKTESCKRPPRLCRQGYACPQYHNSKDKRRSPRQFKYRSTPCPNVKHGEEWGEPSNCDAGDLCSYCHTRTEQQFHPEIYKSTKCNDVQQSGYCPRGVFCAFAHVEHEMGLLRDADEGAACLSDILCGVLPSGVLDQIRDRSTDSSNDVSESASTSSIGSNGSHSKAPGAQLSHKSVSYNRHLSLGMDINNAALLAVGNEHSALDVLDRKAVHFAYNSGLNQSYLGGASDTVGSVVGNVLDELNLEDPLNLSSLEREINNSEQQQQQQTQNSLSVGISSGILGSSAPVNIPGGSRNSLSSAFSPTANSNNNNNHLSNNTNSFLSSGGGVYGHQSAVVADTTTMDFLNHGHTMSKLSSYPNYFDYAPPNNNSSISPGGGGIQTRSSLMNHNSSNSFNMSPANNNTSVEVAVLRDELSTAKLQLTTWEEKLQQARTACDLWKRESEEAQRQKDCTEAKLKEALAQIVILQQQKSAEEAATVEGGPYIRAVSQVSELSKLPASILKTMHAQLRQDLDELEKVLVREAATKCMVCEELNRSVTLNCNHLVLCGTCALTQTECPYCQTPISS